MHCNGWLSFAIQDQVPASELVQLHQDDISCYNLILFFFEGGGGGGGEASSIDKHVVIMQGESQEGGFR